MTEKALLQLCRQRARLLRSALEALEAPMHCGHWACRAMDAVNRELDALERAIMLQGRQDNGRDRD